jgi:hypothetical protein
MYVAVFPGNPLNFQHTILHSIVPTVSLIIVAKHLFLHVYDISLLRLYKTTINAAIGNISACIYTASLTIRFPPFLA